MEWEAEMLPGYSFDRLFLLIFGGFGVGLEWILRKIASALSFSSLCNNRLMFGNRKCLELLRLRRKAKKCDFEKFESSAVAKSESSKFGDSDSATCKSCNSNSTCHITLYQIVTIPYDDSLSIFALFPFSEGLG